MNGIELQLVTIDLQIQLAYLNEGLEKEVKIQTNALENNVESLEMIQRAIGPRDWTALYQQNPVSDEGDYFTLQLYSFSGTEADRMNLTPEPSRAGDAKWRA